jgi:hypothetical protein
VPQSQRDFWPGYRDTAKTILRQRVSENHSVFFGKWLSSHRGSNPCKPPTVQQPLCGAEYAKNHYKNEQTSVRGIVGLKPSN